MNKIFRSPLLLCLMQMPLSLLPACQEEMLIGEKAQLDASRETGSIPDALPVPDTLLPADRSPSGLVGYWSFDEGAGAATEDRSGFANHGNIVRGDSAALTSNGRWVDGKFGKALEFGADLQWVRVPASASLDSVNLKNTFTIAAWVLMKKPMVGNQTILSRTIVGGYPAYAFHLEHMSAPGASPQIQVGMQGFAVSSSVSAEQWNHVAITYDGSTPRFYINGQPDPSITPTRFQLTESEQPLAIGASLYPFPDMMRNYFQGALDEVMLFNKPLSEEEVRRLAAR